MRSYEALLPLVLCCIGIADSMAQNYFVIDPQDPSMVVIGLGDTVSSLNQATCVGRTYKLDIDNNGVDDFQFDHVCQWGSSTGFIDHIKVKSFDGADFVSDTAVTDTLPTITMIVKPFGINDTVDYNSNFTNAVTFISRSEYASGGGYVYYVTDWHGAARYMAIRKEINGQQYYGWIRIHVLNENKSAYIEYALNYPYLDVEDQNESPQVKIFPNPVDHILHIPSGATDITITDLSGKVVYQSGSEKQYAVDITSLASGIYILQADGILQKIVKQ